MQISSFEQAMHLAIDVARQGQRRGYRPFGCIIVDTEQKVIATAYGSESGMDPTRHSEMLAIREACKRYAPGHINPIDDSHLWLRGCTLYSTHEPCPMCCGAINHANISRIVFGSRRSDMPDLFIQRDIDFEARLTDTSVPPMVIAGVENRECIALFDRERLIEQLGGPVARPFLA